MTNFKKLFAALALVAVGSTVAMAQTDFGSPIGAGAGVGGAVAPFLPGARAAGRGAAARPLGAGLGGRIAAVGGILSNSPAAGVLVVNPAGGNVVLSQNIAQALGAVLGGSPTAAQTSTVSAGLAGVPSGASQALLTALQTFGTSGTRGNYVAAINAYNAAVAAVPAVPGGQPMPPALLAIRAALAGAVPRGAGSTR